MSAASCFLRGPLDIPAPAAVSVLTDSPLSAYNHSQHPDCLCPCICTAPVRLNNQICLQNPPCRLLLCWQLPGSTSPGPPHDLSQRWSHCPIVARLHLRPSVTHPRLQLQVQLGRGLWRREGGVGLLLSHHCWFFPLHIPLLKLGHEAIPALLRLQMGAAWQVMCAGLSYSWSALQTACTPGSSFSPPAGACSTCNGTIITAGRSLS